MLISTKGRYALRIMIDLAENSGDGYVPLKEMAARQDISEKYLESILKVLVQNNLLAGLRGKGGGYRPTKAPQLYTVGSILRLICCILQSIVEFLGVALTHFHILKTFTKPNPIFYIIV